MRGGPPQLEKADVVTVAQTPPEAARRPACAGTGCAATFPFVSWHFTIALERETDGRWIAEIPALPGVLAYGATEADAFAAAEALALRVLADRLEHERERRAAGSFVALPRAPRKSRHPPRRPLDPGVQVLS